MKTLELIQGTDEWKYHRAIHFNASDAPTMLGLSPYKTRSELLREIATGVAPEIDPATQKRFDDGHRFEALARPVAEKILGEDLFPVVGYEGKLSASFDGLTMDESVCFEHKTINAAYREAIATGSTLPAALLVQIEQQLMLSGATRCLFMASKWDKAPGSGVEPGAVYGLAVDDNGDFVRYKLVEEVHCFVESDPELRKTLLQGWAQFAIDLEAYQHTEQTVAPVAAPIEALPAVAVTVSGSISLTHNLERFGQRLAAFVQDINTKPQTDQDFVNLDAAVKVLKEAEAALDAAESNALAQTASIADMCNLVATYRKLARDNRLMFEKIVKQEKENRRSEIVTAAATELRAHVDRLNERIGGNWIPAAICTSSRFAEAIKGLKSLDSMRDKVAGALASAKIEASAMADKIEANKKAMGEHAHLFNDFSLMCTKEPADFANLVQIRIESENRRATAERERIRQEEAAKLAAEQAANDQRGKADAGSGEPRPQELRQQPEAASTPPIQDHFADAGNMIDDFIRLLPISAAEKNALRVTIRQWEKYRIARAMQEAA